VNGYLGNVGRTDSAENNLQMLVHGRVDLIPSYRYVALDAAIRLDSLSKIKELSPPIESMPSYLAFTKVRDLSRLSDDFDSALASMKPCLSG
jgi:polar amino acid transport system substrate-binding protein